MLRINTKERTYANVVCVLAGTTQNWVVYLKTRVYLPELTRCNKRRRAIVQGLAEAG